MFKDDVEYNEYFIGAIKSHNNKIGTTVSLMYLGADNKGNECVVVEDIQGSSYVYNCDGTLGDEILFV